ncbi:GNAT superfamily N-acetyltransferase [Paraburkholderia youngii]|uniref:hypothetical protein n=1 Tax=Paraburkholderia youngii TaxID=2782701 RepID=UPI003D199C4E
MNLKIFSLRERPELIPLVFSSELDSMWPDFMRHDRTAKLYFGAGVFSRYLDFAYAGLVDEEVVGRAFGIPFASNIEGRMELPDGGWDEVIRWAHEDSLLGRQPTTISALEVTLLPKARGFGNALALLNALKQCAKMAGFSKLSVPVRPSQKHHVPGMPMFEYTRVQRPDGLPMDSWLRTHLGAGGRLMKIAPYSMTIVGTISEWSRWTGKIFEHSGTAEVDGALVPVHVSMEQNCIVYVEPNVWFQYEL